MHHGHIILPAFALACAGLSACGGGSSDSSSTASTAAAQTSSAAVSSAPAAAAPAATTGSAQIVVDAATTLAPIGAHEIGTNLAVWYDVTSPNLPQEVAALSPTIVRWPGGSTSDLYHWQNHTECTYGASGALASAAAYDANSTFDNFMTSIVKPGGYAAAITVDYGTNAACNGGGDPAEAAAWVAYAKQKGYNSQIQYWTVGNEEFGGWEADLHSVPHDGATYAAAMSGPSGYYAQMKAADPNAQIGAFVLGTSGYNNWDSTVLANAPYDFVELHWYAQQPGQEDDTWLLTQGPAALTTTISTLRQELAAASKPASTPIMLGEVNSVSSSPGKQSMSIVNALFTGMVVGEALNDNLSVATWWFGAGGAQSCDDNNASTLYGWQAFGGYDFVAANSMYSYNYCGTGTVVPEGTVFPSGNAFAMAQQFAQPGNSMLAVSVDAGLPDVRAYAATQGSGYALMLFNLNETTATPATVGVTNGSAAGLSATTITYAKQQYDDSQNNVWTPPVSASLGQVKGSVTVTLPPWSMTVLKLQ